MAYAKVVHHMTKAQLVKAFRKAADYGRACPAGYSPAAIAFWYLRGYFDLVDDPTTDPTKETT